MLERDGHECQLRIEGVCTVRATCVHHLQGKAYGDDPALLVAACDPCNARVSDPNHSSAHQQVVAWARANEPAAVQALARQFPHITDHNLRRILTRAVRRGELVRAARGLYRRGPTGVAPTASADPAPRPRTRW